MYSGRMNAADSGTPLRLPTGSGTFPMAATVTVAIRERRGLTVRFLHARGCNDIEDGVWVPLELVEPPLRYRRPRFEIPARLRVDFEFVRPHCTFGVTCRRLMQLTGMSMEDLKLSHKRSEVTLVRPAILSDLLPTRVELASLHGRPWWKNGGRGTVLHFNSEEQFAALPQDVPMDDLDILVSVCGECAPALRRGYLCGRCVCVE